MRRAHVRPEHDERTVRAGLGGDTEEFQFLLLPGRLSFSGQILELLSGEDAHTVAPMATCADPSASIALTSLVLDSATPGTSPVSTSTWATLLGTRLLLGNSSSSP